MAARLTGAAREARIAEVVQAYVGGESCRNISARTGLGLPTVEGYVRDANAIRHRKPCHEEHPQLFARLTALVTGGMAFTRAVRTVNDEFGTSIPYHTLRSAYDKRSRTVEPVRAEPAPTPKTTVTFGDLVIRKVQVRVPAPDTRNGYALVSLPAVGILAAEARRAAA